MTDVMMVRIVLLILSSFVFIETISQCICPYSKSQTRNFLFHSELTGGSSFMAIINNFTRKRETAYEVCLKLAGDFTQQKIGKIPCYKPMDQTWVTIVRNPYDRLWTYFRYCLQGHEGRPSIFTHALSNHISECEMVSIAFRRKKFSGTDDVKINMIRTKFYEWLLKTQASYYRFHEEISHNAANLWGTSFQLYHDLVGGDSLIDTTFRYEDLYLPANQTKPINKSISSNYVTINSTIEATGGCNQFQKLICSAGFATSSSDIVHLNQIYSDVAVGLNPNVSDFINRMGETYRYWYNETSRKLIEDHFQADMKKYDYQF